MNNHPILISRSNIKEEKVYKDLMSSSGVTVVDTYREQLKELYTINNPQDIFLHSFSNDITQHINNLKKKSSLDLQGVWVYFPWLQTIVHVLKESDFFRVRTARNRYLITENEQEKFYNAHIGIAGLSVGNSIAQALVLMGGVRHLKIADNDTLEVSNMNRIVTGVQNLGEKKVIGTAHRLYEINPFMTIDIFEEGIHKQNIDTFLNKPSLDILIDETDDMSIKYMMRVEAKKKDIPIISAADVGERAVIDIERGKNVFNARLGDVTEESFMNLSKVETGEMITKLIGKEYVSEELELSLKEIGKTIVSWPQLGGTALLNAAAVAFLVRKIVLGKKIEKNRMVITLDEAESL